MVTRHGGAGGSHSLICLSLLVGCFDGSWALPSRSCSGPETLVPLLATLVASRTPQGLGSTEKDDKSTEDGDEEEEAAPDSQEFKDTTDPDEPEDDLRSLLADLDKPEKFMKALDQDGDGKISVQEFVRKNGTDSAERKQASDIFGLADMNGDGFFDLKELTQVISELTEMDNAERAKLEPEMRAFEKSLIDGFLGQQEEETRSEDPVEDDAEEGEEEVLEVGNAEGEDDSAEEGKGDVDESAEDGDDEAETMSHEPETGESEEVGPEDVPAQGLPKEHQKGYAHDEL